MHCCFVRALFNETYRRDHISHVVNHLIKKKNTRMVFALSKHAGKQKTTLQTEANRSIVFALPPLLLQRHDRKIFSIWLQTRGRRSDKRLQKIKIKNQLVGDRMPSEQLGAQQLASLCSSHLLHEALKGYCP